MGDTEIKHDVKLVKHQRIEFTMTVGKHTATVSFIFFLKILFTCIQLKIFFQVICRNKREGKQRAAQAILQLLHPQISSWGSLLRLYGRGSCKTPKEKKVNISSSIFYSLFLMIHYSVLNQMISWILGGRTKNY